MLYAIINEEKRNAAPGLKGCCPFCGEPMLAKCGKINIWHWAHKTACKYNYESETEWHLYWKSIFPKEMTEVMIKKSWSDGVNKSSAVKIADAMLPDETVLEFQHSPISVDEIMIREEFYGNMVWIFDAQKAWDNFFIRNQEQFVTIQITYSDISEFQSKIHSINQKKHLVLIGESKAVKLMPYLYRVETTWKRKFWKPGTVSFEWLWAKRNIQYCKKPVYLDFGEKMVFLTKINGRYGYGILKDKNDVIDSIKHKIYSSNK